MFKSLQKNKKKISEKYDLAYLALFKNLVRHRTAFNHST